MYLRNRAENYSRCCNVLIQLISLIHSFNIYCTVISDYNTSGKLSKAIVSFLTIAINKPNKK